MDYYYYKESTL